MSYFTMHHENELHTKRIEKLFSEYRTKELNRKSLTLAELDNLLKVKYSAHEVIGDPTYFGLVNDPMVDVSRIKKMYTITDTRLLSRLFTDEERQHQREGTKGIIVRTEHDDLAMKLIGGQMIRIAVESEDGINISGYTQQGECIKIAAELFVQTAEVAADEMTLDNDWFVSYLEALNWAGYIGEES